MCLAKTITGKLPEASFTNAYDFTLPDDEWNHVKINTEDEKVIIPENLVNIIRNNVE